MKRLSLQLVLAGAVSAAALVSVGVVGLWSLGDVAHGTREALVARSALLDEASAFEALLWDKGFVASYFLSRDRTWLEQLEGNRRAFRDRLARAVAGERAPEARELLGRIATERESYDRRRNRAIELFDAGQKAQANVELDRGHQHMERLAALCREMRQLARQDTRDDTIAAEARLLSLRWTLVGTSILGALASVVVGFLLARRVTRPIYELQLRVESAAQRTQISLPAGGDLEAVGEQVGALVRKLEEVDATLVDQRRRLIQSEKLSAMGEMAAKLAHEVLNPLAGIKTAVQRLARRAEHGEVRSEDVVATADALRTEIARVEDLTRRLMDYARPLQPRVQPCTVAAIVQAALEPMAPELATHGVTVECALPAELPPIEADPTLLAQTLSNLLRNAAEAMPDGGRVRIEAHEALGGGKRHLEVVVEDEGAGIAEHHQASLFQPFFTTKAKGHGLGLALCQSIVLEHGGRLLARNREDRPGARFEIRLPLQGTA